MVQEGVVNVPDVDAAVAQGPGLRWALMGTVLTQHLGGGAGGLAHLWKSFGPALLCPHLGTTQDSPELPQQLVEGVREELGQRTPEQVARWRDRQLVALLQH